MNGGTYACALKVGFTSEQATMLSRLGAETRQEAIEDFREENKAPNPSRKKRLARAFFQFAVDMAFVLIGYTVGFGLTVQNWPVLLGTLLFARFFWHALGIAFVVNDAKAIADRRWQQRFYPGARRR